MPEQQHTIDELFEAIGIFSNEVNTKFDGVFTRLDKIEGRVSKIETTMITIDYLNDVADNLKTGFSLMLRKEDRKLSSLVDLLKNKSVISTEEASSIKAIEPFPKLM